MPKLSIIIPTFNAASTLERTLNSVYHQTNKDFEVLIIDALSGDATEAIAKKYLRPEDCFISEKDNGIYDAMNKGIQLSKGEFLYFLGADDEIYDENVISNLINSIQPEDELIYGDVIFHSNQIRYNGAFDVSKIMKYNICHQACMYKRDIFEKVGLYNIKFQLFADYWLNVLCFTKGLKCRYLDLILCNYNDLGLSYKKRDFEFDRQKKTLWLMQFSKYFTRKEILRGLNYKDERDAIVEIKKGNVLNGILGLLKLYASTFDGFYLRTCFYWLKMRLKHGRVLN